MIDGPPRPDPAIAPPPPPLIRPIFTMPDPTALDPDEIIPPARAGSGKQQASGTRQPSGLPPVADLRGLLPAFVAKWLDDLLRIPGTNIRIGLDPLLSLIPGLGDAASTTAGAAILLSAVRHRAPLGLLARMGGNMAGNALLNLIPVIGPAASIWYRSNSRNNQMLQKHLAGHPPGPPSPQTKILLALVILFVLGRLVAGILVWIALFRFVSALFQ